MTEEQLDSLVEEFCNDLASGYNTPKIMRVVKNGVKSLSGPEIEEALARAKDEEYPIFAGD